MWIDVLIVLGMVVWAYIAVRYLKRPRRRGCNRDMHQVRMPAARAVTASKPAGGARNNPQL